MSVDVSTLEIQGTEIGETTVADFYVFDLQGIELELSELQELIWPNGRDYPLYNEVRLERLSANWGASSEVANYVVKFMMEVPIEIVVGMVIERVYRKHFAEVKIENPDVEEAKRRARWAILVRYASESDDSIQLTSAESTSDNSHHEFEFSGVDARYIVTIGEVSGVPGVTRCKRVSRPGT